MVVYGGLFAFEDKSPSTAVETSPDFSFCFHFDPIISCFCSPNTAAQSLKLLLTHTKHLLLLLRHIKSITPATQEAAFIVKPGLSPRLALTTTVYRRWSCSATLLIVAP